MKIHSALTIQDANNLLFRLFGFELVLVLMFAVAPLIGTPGASLDQLFNLDLEGNIPSWFSSSQFFVIGLIVLLKSQNVDNGHHPSSSFFLLVGISFIFLSMDETASFHERISVIISHFEFMPRFKDGHGIWIYLYALIAGILFFANFRSFIAMFKFYKRETLFIILGFGIIVFGAVVLEIISYQFLRGAETPIAYAVEVACEEFFEMSGASIVLYGSLLLLIDDKKA